MLHQCATENSLLGSCKPLKGEALCIGVMGLKKNNGILTMKHMLNEMKSLKRRIIFL